ncbi:MAG: ATP-grasp domain-containing protein [Lachnospiraceae bacterium]|nr:ATP-grasp domain-containing protein [Lachnospiraceae bacterium]
MNNNGINILILSAGRRVELVNCFKAARDRLGISGKVVACDASNLAPALYFADVREQVPRIAENDNYVNSFIEICNRYEIDLVVPTIDTELLLLAERLDEIEAATKAKVLISSLDVIRICRDKTNTQRWLEEHGFLVPRMISDDEIDAGRASYPLFIKPLDGSSSINAFKAENKEEIDTYRELIGDGKYIIQDFMEGTEYTIDCFLDMEGEIITVVPRIRIATRSGEIAKGRIVRDKAIIEDVTRLLTELKPIGHITIQCMRTDRGIEYIEINPRFGGGAPMSIMAGADSCENLYRILRGEKLKRNEAFRENVTFLRFDASIMLNEDNELESQELNK